MSTFLSAYLKHNELYESPTSFWHWSGHASIAAVLRDNCFLQLGERRLYSNIYVLSIAESSGYRKGPPVDLSETLVSKIGNTKIISGRSSIQAVMDELARVESDKKTGKITKAGSAIFYAPEMKAGIVADPDALSILTDIYDYKTNPYKSRLRTGPCFNLDRIALTMLAASNEAMLKGLLGIGEIQGGFLARICLVTPSERRPPNDLLDLNEGEIKESLNNVLSKLKEISDLKGAFILTPKAKAEYRDWYNPFNLSYLENKESSGIRGRIHTTVLKIALIHAANRLSLELSKEDVEGAIDECMALLPNYSIFTMSQGKSEFTQLAGMVIMELQLAKSKEYTLKQKELMRKLLPNGMTPDLLEKIVLGLEMAGSIKQIQSKEGLYIQLTESALKDLGQSATSSKV